MKVTAEIKSMTGETKNKSWISRRDNGKIQKLVTSAQGWNILEKS